jgi:glycosyltransferase involved in cell wall biosynthesis
MTPLISLLMPTRGRPALVRRFLASVVQHTHDLDGIELVLYVDEDDPESHDVGDDRVPVRRIIGPVATMGEYNAACLEQASGSIIVLANDDVVIQSPGWDERIRAVDRDYPDGIYLAYPNDLLKRRRVATFPVLSRRACEVLGEPYPRQYRGALIDYHLLDVFKRLEKSGLDRIRYMDDVVFEHMHHRTGKAPFDDTYGRRNRWQDDGTFIALREMRQRAAERLEAAIAGRHPPPVRHAPPEAVRPTNFAAAFVSFARAFLADRALPLPWRLFLFTWCCGRYVAAGRSAVRPAS